MPWTPHDLPFIVEKAHARYVELAEEFQVAIDARDDVPGDAVVAVRGLLDSAHLLDSPPLFWADSDICDLLAHGGEVPPWSPESCMPGERGFVGLESPFFTAAYEHADYESFSQVRVCAVGWECVGSLVRVTAWCHRGDVPVVARSQTRMGLELEELFAITFPVGDVVDDETVFAGFDSPGIEVSSRALRDAIGGFWLLMAQPRMVEERPSQPVRVRKTRGGVTRRAPVRVSVRSLVASPGGRGGGSGRKATKRWWVRGHWRQQAWGKGRKLRKPVFIQPHTAGAQGVEVDDRPSVQVWRTGDEG